MPSTRGKTGQVALLLVFMLMGLLFLALVNVDAFLSTHRKNRLQNAGDAAALAAARWQGITLNAIGALNMLKIETMCDAALRSGGTEMNPLFHEQATNLCERITALQERLSFAGPLMGLYAAQRAAEKNGVDTPDGSMSTLVNEAIARASSVPATLTWPGKADDYAQMLRGAAGNGIVVGADNAQYYNFSVQGAHPLYSKAFYYAVDGEDWCWFYLRDPMMDLLAGFSGWGEAPPGAGAACDNPEFFGTDTLPAVRSLADVGSAITPQEVEAHVLELAALAGCRSVDSLTLATSGVLTNSVDMTWWTYDASQWGTWRRMHRSDEARLPLISDVQERFDVQGCFAATRTMQILRPITPDVPERENVWTAAAKPFGEIDGRTVTFNGAFPLVAPLFSDVRLVMLGAFDANRMGMADDAWVVHTRDHVQNCANGMTFDGCRYCATLKKWNSPEFRRSGVDWLSENGESCRLPTGGPGSSGGTRYAH